MMSYDESTGSYRGWLWLKQGYYDYFYWLKSDKMPFMNWKGAITRHPTTMKFCFTTGILLTTMTNSLDTAGYQVETNDSADL